MKRQGLYWEYHTVYSIPSVAIDIDQPGRKPYIHGMVHTSAV